MRARYLIGRGINLLGGSVRNRLRFRGFLNVTLLLSALCAAFFHNGTEIFYLCLTSITLLFLVGRHFLHNLDAGIPIPLGASAFLLYLLWIWSAASLFWSEVPYATAVSFWWFGALPLAFLAVVLDREGRDHWHATTMAVAGVGLGLVLYQCYQWVHGESPSGPLLNRNNLAALLNLSLFCLVGGYGYFRRRRRLAADVLLPVAVFIFAFGSTLTGSRGALLALLLSGAILIAYLTVQVGRRQALGFAAAVLAGVVVANLLQQDSGAVARIETLAEPDSAGASRFVIWSAAAQMALERPWLGTGLGTFWLAYPPYRSPDDTSGGFYAHNDLLQFTVELGVPGGLLLLAWLVAVAWLAVRLIFSTRLGSAVRLEAASLACGMLAVAVHSLFTFNFYILPILVLYGAAFGRLYAIGVANAGARQVTLSPRRWFTGRGYTLIISLLFLLTSAYHVSLVLGHRAYESARDAAVAGYLEEADAFLQRQARLTPAHDAPYLAQARLLLSVLENNLDAEPEVLTALFEEGVKLLGRAQEANRLRPDGYVLEARYRALAEQGGFGPPADIHALYRRALALDPLYFKGRLAYARYLLDGKQGATRAREVLEEGMRYQHPVNSAMQPYYRLLRELRRDAGDLTDELDHKLEQIHVLQRGKIRSG